jgi:hypothetical protein
MTGFKLHYPPGFVDRAYLVFLVAVTLLTELPDDDDLSRSHPPFGFGWGFPAVWPGYEPLALARRTEIGSFTGRLGAKLGR